MILYSVSVCFFGMIKITVRLENDFDSRYDEIEITKEELKQMACNKAKGMYQENHWHTISADDDIEVRLNTR